MPIDPDEHFAIDSMETDYDRTVRLCRIVESRNDDIARLEGEKDQIQREFAESSRSIKALLNVNSEQFVRINELEGLRKHEISQRDTAIAERDEWKGEVMRWRDENPVKYTPPNKKETP